MKISEIKRVLEIAHEVSDSVLISGDAGLGKSYVVKEYAEENNYHFEDLRLGNQEIGDLIGIPTIQDGVTIWTEPVWLYRMKEAEKQGKKSVLFLDELNRSQQDVKVSALQIVLDKQIHQHKLPKDVLVVGAINPTESEQGLDYYVDELDPALLDRFLQVKVSLDVESWLSWARNNKINNIITSYIAENPRDLYNVPKDGQTRIATPRSWATLSRYIDLFEKTQTFDVEIVSGRIGEALAFKFQNYYNNFNKQFTIKDVIKLVDISKAPKENKNILISEFNKRKLDTLQIRELALLGLKKFEKHMKAINIPSEYTADYEKAKNCVSDDELKKVNPLMSLLYALKPEELASVINELKQNDEEYKLLIARIDFVFHGKKELYLQLLNKVTPETK